jgi:hypothetical protein
MRFLLPAALAVVLMTGSAASAQTVGPTDNDILAAYCIGVAQGVAGIAEVWSKATVQCRQKHEHEDFCRMYEDSATQRRTQGEAIRRRSINWLFARGYFGTNLDMLQAWSGFHLMRQSAERDFRICGQDQSKCVDACPKGASDDEVRASTKCVTQCGPGKISTCAPIERCQRTDVLP